MCSLSLWPLLFLSSRLRNVRSKQLLHGHFQIFCSGVVLKTLTNQCNDQKVKAVQTNHALTKYLKVPTGQSMIVTEQAMLKSVMAQKHPCTLCPKSFPKLSDLTRHMLSHTGEKLHNCEQCNKAFKGVGSLKIHMLTHTGEKKHKCNQCHYSATKSSILRVHMQVHTGEKLHNCG